jgi:hypothetical protein
LPEHFGIPVNTLDLLDRLDTDDEAIAADLSDLVRGSIATGERRDELLGADWPDFDGHAKELQVISSLIRRAQGRDQERREDHERGTGHPASGLVRGDARGPARPAPGAEPDRPDHLQQPERVPELPEPDQPAWLPFRRRAGCEWVAFKTLRKRSPPCSTTPGSPPAGSPLGLGVRRSK